jgi:hypothetical protein
MRHARARCGTSPNGVAPDAVRVLNDRVLAVVAVGAVLGAAGCGRGDDRAAVRAVTDRFFAAVDSQDGRTACAQLSPSTRTELQSQEQKACSKAVTALELQRGTVIQVEIYLRSAAVELSSGETAFLDQGERGWRLSAVGCRPESGKPSDRPYDCELES